MKIKSKKFFYPTLLIISTITTIYTLFFILFNNKIQNTKEIFNSSSSQEQKNYKYIVKNISGKINIFENGNSNPIGILDKEIDYLPEYDQKMLKQGIYIENFEQLNKILEDYDD